jgi:hypothetical protein
MNSTIEIISPLRQRFLDEMRMRKLSPKTQSGYLRTVNRFYHWLGRSPDTATVEDLCRFRHSIHVINKSSIFRSNYGIRRTDVSNSATGKGLSNR